MRKFFVFLSFLVVASMMLSACGAPAAAPQTIVQTQVVQVEVTPTAAPAAEFKSKDPTTLVNAVFGEPETLDPALAYETAGGEIIQNVKKRIFVQGGCGLQCFICVYLFKFLFI